MTEFDFRFKAGKHGQIFETETSVWRGTSVLWYCRKRPEVRVQGEEGRYWLWFEATDKGRLQMRRYVIIDYTEKKAKDKAFWRGRSRFCESRVEQLYDAASDDEDSEDTDDEDSDGYD